jgi:hypothetical protein
VSGPTGDGVPPSRLVEEATRLAEAAQEWLRGSAGGAGSAGAAGSADSADRPVDAAGPCRYCPVCQLVAALRDGHPELADRFGELAAALIAALHAAFETATAPSGPPRSSVQHIRVDGQESM